MKTEFNFKKELQKIYEEELSGKVTNAGRIYRKLRARDKEFIKKLKEELMIKQEEPTEMIDEYNKELFDKINTLAGKYLEENKK